MKTFQLTNRIVAVFIPYLSRPGFKLLSWLLQCFGHIQSKNKDAKSALSIVVVFIEKCGRFLERCTVSLVSKGLKLD